MDIDDLEIRAALVAPHPMGAARQPPFWRAILLGSLLIPPSLYYGNYAYVVVQALEWGQTALQRGAVFMLFAVVLANLLFRKASHRAGLTAGEMLIIYAMVAVSVCVSGFGMQQFLINLLPAGSYFASPINHYDKFLHYVPTYMVPHDPQAIKDFLPGPYESLPGYILRDWAVPVLVWTLFLCGMCWVTLCLSALVRRQWVDEEKLTFPLVSVPLEMARAGRERPRSGAAAPCGSASPWRAFWSRWTT